MARGKKRILIVAGEASGDLHGSGVVAELSRRTREFKFRRWGASVCGPAGAEMLIDSSQLAVVGITEVLGRLGSAVPGPPHSSSV